MARKPKEDAAPEAPEAPTQESTTPVPMTPPLPSEDKVFGMKRVNH